MACTSDLLRRGIEMGNRLSLLRHVWPLLLVVLAACAASETDPSSSQAAAVSDADVIAQARQAEVDGKKLFEAYSQGITGDAAEVATARAAVTDYCAGDAYKAVEVADARPGQDFVYLIASTGSSDDIVWGRHYRVALDKAHGSFATVSPSTRSCFAMSLTRDAPPGYTLVSPSVTHLLSAAPSEFHVFLSLTESKPLTVMTSYGIWNVQAGKISLIAKRGPKDIN